MIYLRLWWTGYRTPVAMSAMWCWHLIVLKPTFSNNSLIFSDLKTARVCAIKYKHRWCPLGIYAATQIPQRDFLLCTRLKEISPFMTTRGSVQMRCSNQKSGYPPCIQGYQHPDFYACQHHPLNIIKTGLILSSKVHVNAKKDAGVMWTSYLEVFRQVAVVDLYEGFFS